MSIGLTDNGQVEVRERLEFSQLFMDELHIQQSRRHKVTDQPHFNVRFSIRMMAQESDGTLHYKEKSDMIDIPDYSKEALEKYLQGNPVYLQAMAAIEEVIAEALRDKRHLSLEVS